MKPCSIFFVDKDIYCWWDSKVQRVNLDFLATIDVRFWYYTAELHSARLNSEDELRAALALRQTYYHALETFFTLVAALVQAPFAVPAFIPKCSTPQLREIIQRIQCKQQVDSLWHFESFDWEAISTIVHSGTWSTDQQLELNQSFASAWRDLAAAFLRSDSHEEYNSIKHGFRASSGGFVLAAGPEEIVGVACPPENMSIVERSRTGAKYCVPAPMTDYTAGGKNPHFVLRTQGVNWSPLDTLAVIRVLSDSIQNVVSRLQILNGATGQIPFRHPNREQFAAGQNAARIQPSFATTPHFSFGEKLHTAVELREIVRDLNGHNKPAVLNPPEAMDEW